MQRIVITDIHLFTKFGLTSCPLIPITPFSPTLFDSRIYFLIQKSGHSSSMQKMRVKMLHPSYYNTHIELILDIVSDN